MTASAKLQAMVAFVNEPASTGVSNRLNAEQKVRHAPGHPLQARRRLSCFQVIGLPPGILIPYLL
jgi:hypothetical protein